MHHEVFDDIVFEKRNKKYGAYDLRRKYVRYLLLGFFISIFCIAVAYVYFYYVNFLKTDDYSFKAGYTQYIQYDIDEELQQLAQYKIEEPVEKRIVQTVAPKVVHKEEIKIDTAVAMKVESTPPVDSTPGESVVDDYVKKDSLTGDLIVKVDSLPKFNGDVNGFRTYLVSKIKYPDTSLLRMMQGKLVVSIVILENGNVGKITLDKVESTPWAQDLMNVIKKAPRWQPAFAKGKPVSILFSLPLYFMK